MRKIITDNINSYKYIVLQIIDFFNIYKPKKVNLLFFYNSLFKNDCYLVILKYKKVIPQPFDCGIACFIEIQLRPSMIAKIHVLTDFL